MDMVMEQVVDVNGCRVRMSREGKGPTLIYLHGANGPNPWTQFFDDLAKRFTVLAPDHPSFGGSDDPQWLEDIGDLAYFYLDFLKAMNLKGVHLVGHSMGGWLAAEIAVRSTERIATLTLIAAAGLRVPGHNGVDIFLTPPAEMAGKYVYADPELSRKMLEEAAKPKTEQELDMLIRNRTSAAKLCWHPRLNNPQLARWLHRIDVPTHLIWGDSDRIIPPAHGEAYKKLIPGAKLTTIARCGHGAMVECPREMVDAVANFAMERVS
jgi:pimeloyl-ACP methyl ester carboxylesterase